MPNEDPTNAKIRTEVDASVEKLKEFLATHRVGESLTPPSNPDPRKPRWNILGVLSPIIVGVPVYGITALFIENGGWGWGIIARILIAIIVSALFGIFAACVAASRDERRPAITALALGINIFLILRCVLPFLIGR